MRTRLAAGDNLILFPEGTTSDGSRVLPFRSAFFSIAEQAVTADGRPPLVQPVSVVYDRLAYLPAGRATRPLFAWYGDMDIGSHFWRLAQHRGLRATVLLHAPLDPARFPTRKALAQATWTAVADGAATLRQNRPARPISVADRRRRRVPTGLRVSLARDACCRFRARLRLTCLRPLRRDCCAARRGGRIRR